MQIDYIACPENIEDKLESKHNVAVKEAREILLGKNRIRFAEKATRKEKMYMLLSAKLSAGDIWRYSSYINPQQKQRLS